MYRKTERPLFRCLSNCQRHHQITVMLIMLLIQHLSRDISICCLRLFKSSTGYTPNEYIIMERINHAKELLRSTDLTINEVADKVGFHNPGHFINLFKRSLGMAPGMYRSFWGQGQRRKLEGSI